MIASNEAAWKLLDRYRNQWCSTAVRWGMPKAFAEDIVQDCYAELFQRGRDPSRANMAGLLRWRVAEWLRRSYGRAGHVRRRWKPLDSHDAPSIASTESASDAKLDCQSLLAKTNLSRTARAIVKLRLADMSRQQIIRKLGIPAGTHDRVWWETRRKLHNLFERGDVL